MKTPMIACKFALVMLALAPLATPVTCQADDKTDARAAQILKKYDANHNGKLDPDEVAKLKADEAVEAAKKAQAADEKMDRRSTKEINHSIKQSQKKPKRK